jgi:hypothetical protein
MGVCVTDSKLEGTTSAASLYLQELKKLKVDKENGDVTEEEFLSLKGNLWSTFMVHNSQNPAGGTPQPPRRTSPTGTGSHSNINRRGVSDGL